MKKRAIIIFILLLVLGGCSNHDYTFQLFAYPPGAKPHESNWSHICEVITTAKHSGPVTQNGPKKIEVRIENKSGEQILKDKIEVVSASIDAEVTWENFEDVQVLIYEKGNPFAEDEHNRNLVKKGKKLIARIEYVYNARMKAFEKQSLTKK